MPAALFSQTRQQVLALFLMRPEERYYVREVARRTGKAVGTVQGELASLAEAGVLTRVVSGNRTYYQANADCAIFPELRRIVLKTVGLVDVLRDRLKPLSRRIETAFVYGSMAGGEPGPQSDIDLIVVGDVDEMRLHRALSQAEETLARPVNYTLMDPGEFARRRAEGEGFLSRVLEGPRMSVIGGSDEMQ
jgi:predicted nucleotidyltransferase